MNRNKLKTYAPAARREFIQAVKDRAVLYGLSAKKIEPMTERGDVVLIAGQPFPKAVAAKRKRLEERVASVGFERAMEAIAYSWFNRFVAIRFMELHGYLDHGYRVLSHPAGDVQPEILEHAQRVDFPGLDKNKVVELKLDGTKQEELYRLLLVAQCNALSQAMPFLFERIDDETELLLPSNLLATDSLIQNLVKEIDEEDWKEVEILGWLYQFYISERKDEVIGKVVASEDIPAATQLFTPNWIVKYLVQNTLGRIWLATYPQSGIRQQMEFYIEPAEQTPEVQEQLKAITPTSLNPEELTLLDPACGSAHILVEAYDLFKAIYQERGYRAKDIPGLILSKNLYGLEIDDRAAQLAAFALLMKARADDRRILESGVQPAILSFVESKGMDAGAIAHALNSPINRGVEGTVAKADITALLELFEDSKTFGSLIQIPAGLAERLPTIEERLAVVLKDGDLTHAQAGVIQPLLRQATLLAHQYDAVVANPPYLGRKAMDSLVKDYLDGDYPDAAKDVFAAFMHRCRTWAAPGGFLSLVTPVSWMYLGSFETLRKDMLRETLLTSLVELEVNAFEPAMVSVCCFSQQNSPLPGFVGSYVRLADFRGADNQAPKTMEAIANRSCGWIYAVCPTSFLAVPSAPIAYWLPSALLATYAKGVPLADLAEPRIGMATCNNQTFIRYWFEVPIDRIAFDCESRQQALESQRKWFPYAKGGAYRKWYGNCEDVVDWQNDGERLRTTLNPKNGKVRAHNFNLDQIFQPAIVWTTITVASPSFRLVGKGFLYDAAGGLCPVKSESDTLFLLGLLCSTLVETLLKATNPTLNLIPSDLDKLPVLWGERPQLVKEWVMRSVEQEKEDWDAFEGSWDYRRDGIVSLSQGSTGIREAFTAWGSLCACRCSELQQLETKINAYFIDTYDLSKVMQPHIDAERVTAANAHLERDIRLLLSYAVGCMMGRYSLDHEGLIYAHSGNQGFDPAQYTKFPADDDGIVPVTEAPWFDDDAANRFERFVKTAWPAETLEENLVFVAESLGAKKTETPRETIRRYFASDFYKHHLQTYKNRPIFWLFSSGKQGAFEALVYLHRYNEGTLSRMRTEYVVPLLGKMNGRLGMLADTIAKATSTKQRKDAEKEKDKLAKQLAELQAFDDKLRHYADQRITLDLDDGVRVNYGKFGDLLADVKKVCGKAEDE
jgi:hypothetical protein